MPDTQTATSPSPTLAVQSLTPNLYTLSGGGLHVTYATTSFTGKPQFTYEDQFRTLTFTGNQISTTDVPQLGTIVSVFIVQTVDSGSTSFSLLVPAVQLTGPFTASAPISTYGITTMHRFSIVQLFNNGQRESYSATPLTGTAAHVVF